jgi:hypothetical protein
VPKFHMGGVHLPLQCAFINPRFVWTYKAEDWVGRVSTIAHSASFGTGSHKLYYKLVGKYQFLLFLCFTRMFYGGLSHSFGLEKTFLLQPLVCHCLLLRCICKYLHSKALSQATCRRLQPPMVIVSSVHLIKTHSWLHKNQVLYVS